MSDRNSPSDQTPQYWGILGMLVFVVMLVLLLFALVPSVSTPMINSQKNRAASDIRQIAISYISYSHGTGTARSITRGDDPKHGQASNPAQYAEVLARGVELTTGDVWYIKSDEALDGIALPGNVLSDITDGENNLKTVGPISWAVVIGASKNLTDQYPLLWTRGLQENGTWSENSPWKRAGGHIAFGDGHVRWYDDLNQIGDRLLGLRDGKETSNFQDAIGPNAVAMEDKVDVKH